MKKIISITPVISWCSLLQAQDIKRYVQENAVRVNSNQPDSIEFSDIIAISNAIDDSRIVFMGEQNQSSLKTYTIGFTSYEGTAAILGSERKIEVKTPDTNSFEKWINESYNFSFVDFQKFNQVHQDANPRFVMKGLHHNNLKARWTKIFDGVFFIREMYPCKLISNYSKNDNKL